MDNETKEEQNNQISDQRRMSASRRSSLQSNFSAYSLATKQPTDPTSIYQATNENHNRTHNFAAQKKWKALQKSIKKHQNPMIEKQKRHKEKLAEEINNRMIERNALVAKKTHDYNKALLKNAIASQSQTSFNIGYDETEEKSGTSGMDNHDQDSLDDMDPTTESIRSSRRVSWMSTGKVKPKNTIENEDKMVKITKTCNLCGFEFSFSRKVKVKADQRRVSRGSNKSH